MSLCLFLCWWHEDMHGWRSYSESHSLTHLIELSADHKIELNGLVKREMHTSPTRLWEVN